MYSRRLEFRYLLIVGLVALIGTSTVLGQGRGRGNGNGNGGGRGQEKQFDRGDRGGKKDRDYDRGERGEIRQRQRDERSGRGQFESPIWRQRPDFDRGNGNRGRGRRDSDQPIFFPRRNDDDDGYYRRQNDDRRRNRGDRNSRGRIVVLPYPYDYNYGRGPRNYGPFKNYGQYRSNQVHIRNERRKALRDGRYWNNYYHNDDYYDDRRYRRTDWRRVILGNILGNEWGNRYNSYAPVYRGRAYEPVYYSYAPTYVERRYYDDPYNYSPSYYNGDYYSDDLTSPLFGDSSVGQFVSRLLGGLLANGYDQGFLAGQYARSNGYGNRGYYDPYDPYVYNNVSFDNIDYNPYSSLGERNRYLSEGYELGYRDGLRDGAQNASYYDRGNSDLVSLFVGSFL